MLPKRPNKYSVNTVLAKPISDLCNLSINSDLCKVAKLKPLYLKGSLTQPCNYRPISLLPLISKVITKVIHNQTSTSEFKKIITHLPIRFSKKIFYRFLPFLFEWQNFNRLWKGYDEWHDSNWSSKGLWHNWSWHTFVKIICYWFLKAYCKLVSILFIQQIISS